MPYKIMMSVAAAVPLIFAVAFLVVPHFFILESYPNAEGLALEIGITQRYVMSGMLFMTACIAFQSRNVEKVDDQKAILLGQLNVVENKIVPIVLYYPLLATPANSSQSDTLQEKSPNS